MWYRPCLRLLESPLSNPPRSPICDDENMLSRCAALAPGLDMLRLLAQFPATPVPTADQQLTLSADGVRSREGLGTMRQRFKGYEDALQRVQSDASLKKREQEVLQHLAAGYIAAQRPLDAVRVSTDGARFTIRKTASRTRREWSGARMRSTDSALAMMHAGDFAGAVNI